jgi:hypothetical protein
MNLPGKVVQFDRQNNKSYIKSLSDFNILYWVGPCNVPCKSCGALHWLQEAAQADIGKRN